jgi:hypothetical protein
LDLKLTQGDVLDPSSSEGLRRRSRRADVVRPAHDGGFSRVRRQLAARRERQDHTVAGGVRRPRTHSLNRNELLRHGRFPSCLWKSGWTMPAGCSTGSPAPPTTTRDTTACNGIPRSNEHRPRVARTAQAGSHSRGIATMPFARSLVRTNV